MTQLFKNSLLTGAEFLDLLAWPMVTEDASVVSGKPLLLVDTQAGDAMRQLDNYGVAQLPNCPVIGYGPNDHPLFDVMLQDSQALALVCESITAQPAAAATLVQLLRHNVQVDVVQGLFAESLAYSSLQQSGGFQNWLQQRKALAATQGRSRPRPAVPEVPLLVQRRDAELSLLFNRPHKHNAYNDALRDELCAALHTAIADQTITKVLLGGVGKSFCAGGDLDEFGRVNDAALAHLTRTTRSAGRLLDQLSARTRVRVQGACIGAGIELPAFTQHIEAQADAFFQLPEVSMGLVPGAGGTVSVTRRIGRQRTAYMALTNVAVDVTQALAWGLIDAVVD